MRSGFARYCLGAWFTLAGTSLAFAQADDFDFNVDLELVLAVDVSRSMDVEEQRIQREGYVAAFRHPDIVDAVRSGALGRIAVTYFEWAGAGDQAVVVVPWTLIESATDAEAFADQLGTASRARLPGTSISGAMAQAGDLFGLAYRGYRQAVDISGDGPNNSGRPVEPARDRLVAQGVTINGLPIMLNTVSALGYGGIPNLDRYYQDCVIGGPGAFVIAVRSMGEFAEAIRRKLILEIAGLPAQVIRAAEVVAEAKTDCLIGEKTFRGLYGGERFAPR